MKTTSKDVLIAALANGPVKYRELMHGRSAAARLAYAGLLRRGVIEENGTGTAWSPKYVGVRGAQFPKRNYYVRAADIALLVRSGMSEVDAEATLTAAVKSGGEDAVFKVCEQAHVRLLSLGKSPLGKLGRKLQPDHGYKRGQPLFQPMTPEHWDNK